jgi:hypothetical protein
MKLNRRFELAVVVDFSVEHRAGVSPIRRVVHPAGDLDDTADQASSWPVGAARELKRPAASAASVA